MSRKVNKLQVRLAEREAELEETREILAQSEYTTSTTKKSVDEDFLDKVSTLVESKMKTLEEKFETMQKKMERKNEEVKKVTLSFSDAVTKNLDRNFDKKSLTSAIQDSKNTDRIIETERNKKEKNLILHGVSEMSDTDDKAYV